MEDRFFGLSGDGTPLNYQQMIKKFEELAIGRKIVDVGMCDCYGIWIRLDDGKGILFGESGMKIVPADVRLEGKRHEA